MDKGEKKKKSLTSSGSSKKKGQDAQKNEPVASTSSAVSRPVDLPRSQFRMETPLCSRGFPQPLIEAVREEVALEGLDGITFQGLKARLEARVDLQLDGFEDIAPALWTQMKISRLFRFYMMSRARPDLELYCWEDYRDERGNCYEPLHAPEEIYLYNPIEDKQKKIRGSCMDYENRKDITDIIKSCGYTDIIQLFGNRLAIVAHQHIREKALFGCNYKKYSNLSVVQYCIMERVGRARFYGEITRGKISSSCMNIPPKTQFYMRKRLLQEGLIKRQSVSIRYANSRCPALVTVFHLPRFFRRIEAISSLNTRIVFSWLNNSPTKSIPVEMVVSKYGKHTMRNLTNQFPSLLETAWEKVASDENDEEGKKKKARAVRVLRLKHCDVQIQSQIIARVMEGQNVEDVDLTAEAPTAESQPAEETEVTAISLRSASSFSGVKILRPTHQYLTCTLNYRLFSALLRAGVGGLTLLDIATLMSLTPLESRSTTRFLMRHHCCREGMIKIYKQKAFTYILCLFSNSDLEIHLAMQEKFMMATHEMERIRKAVEMQDRKKLQERLKKAKKQRKLREKRARAAALLAPPPPPEPAAPISAPEQTADSPAHISEDQQEPAVPSTSKSHKEKKKKDKKKSRHSKKHRSKRRSGLMETMPESLSISIPLSMTRSPDKDFSLSTPSLCLVTATDQAGPSPSSHLVAVISTREATSSPKKEHHHGQANENGSHIEELPSGEDLDEDLISMVSQGSYEEFEEEDVSTSRRHSRGDSIDEQIKRRMTRKRVDWKEHEDKFILYSFIASSLFISKYNYSKVFFYNAPQIRDIMLKKTDGKSNKTSAAIRRRIHFLLHQQHRFEEYIALAGAALRDHTLYEIYIKEHMQPPQQKIYFNPPIDALESVIDYLTEKFRAEEDSIVTDMRNSLTGIDTLLFLRQLKRSEFYWNALLFAIFCPLDTESEDRAAFYKQWRRISASSREGTQQQGGRTVKAKRAPESDDQKTPHDLYLEYCYKFLRFIAKQCNIMFKSMLIYGSMNLKGFQVVSMDMSTAHSNISTCVRECNSDAEVRLWTARCIVLDLIFSGDSSKLGEKKIIDKCKYPLERAARSLQRAKVLVFSKRTGLMGVSRLYLRAFVAGLPSYSYDEMLDFIKYLDESVVVDSLACISVGILYGIVELTDFLNTEIRVTESIFTLNEDWAALYDELPPLEEELKRKKDAKKKPEEVIAKKSKPKPLKHEHKKKHKSDKAGKSDKKSSKKKRRATLEEEQELDALLDDDGFEDIDGDIFKEPAADTTTPQAKEGPVGLEEGENYTSSSNSNALRLLRIRLNQAAGQTANTTGFVEKDFFTLNLPSLEFSLPKKSSLNHSIAGHSHPFCSEELMELRKKLVELVFHQVPAAPFKAPNMDKILGKYAKIFDLISFSGVVGLSGAYLKTVFEPTLLVKGLQHMIEAKLLFSVGVAHRRYVTYNNINDWVIPIRPRVGGGSVGHVIMRPWITSMGGLSWITVSRLLTSLLGQLQKPAILLDELCRVFAPTLSAVESIVLIEVLAHLKYVTIYRLKEPKVGLWSKPAKLDTPHIEYNADTLVDTKDVYVAMSPYLTFLHSQLNQTIQKAYKKQTLGEHHKGS